MKVSQRKKRNKIIISSFLIVLSLSFLLILVTSLRESEDAVGIVAHYYKNGVEVFEEQGLRQTFIGSSGVDFDQISFSIFAKNTGAYIINNLMVHDAYPQAFLNALPTTTQTLGIGEEKILWTSALMDSEQFELISPVTFFVNVSWEHPASGTMYDFTHSDEIIFSPTVELPVCSGILYLGDCDNPGNPMSIGGHIYDESGTPYQAGTEISFVSECQRVEIQSESNGILYTKIPGHFGADIIECWGNNFPTSESVFDDIFLYIDGENTGQYFEFERFSGEEINIGSCEIETTNEECGINNCFNGVYGTCGFGYSCESNMCIAEGDGGTDDSLFCYSPNTLFEESYIARDSWIERVEFSNIDAISGKDYDDGHEDLTNNIAYVNTLDGLCEVKVTLGSDSDNKVCAAAFLGSDGDFEDGFSLGCCNYNGCTVSEMIGFDSDATYFDIIRIKSKNGDFSNYDMSQPCENDGETEDYSIVFN